MKFRAFDSTQTRYKPQCPLPMPEKTQEILCAQVASFKCVLEDFEHLTCTNLIHKGIQGTTAFVGHALGGPTQRSYQHMHLRIMIIPRTQFYYCLEPRPLQQVRLRVATSVCETLHAFFSLGTKYGLGSRRTVQILFDDAAHLNQNCSADVNPILTLPFNGTQVCFFACHLES